MTDREDEIILSKTALEDSNQQKKSLACLEKTYSRYLIIFSNFLHFVE